MALLQSFFMLYRHSAEEACMAASELCAGVEAHQAGVPAQQHLAELAVRESQQNQAQHTPSGEAGSTVSHAAAAVANTSESGSRSYPAPDPAAIPKGPPPKMM